MKKHLLLLVGAVLTAMSGFALETGDYVYTPTGRYQILGGTGDVTVDLSNLNSFTAVVSEGSTSTLESMFTTGIDGSGNNYFNSNVAVSTATTSQSGEDFPDFPAEGMYYKFPSLSGTYIVSFKIKSEDAPTTPRTINNQVDWKGNNGKGTYYRGANENYINIFSTAAGEGVNGTKIATFGAESQISTEWITVCYAVEFDPSNEYYLEFLSMNPSVQVMDIEVKAALEVADLRKKEQALRLAEAYVKCYNWPDDSYLMDMQDNIVELQGIEDDSTPVELTNALDAIYETIKDFRNAKMDDLLFANAQNKLPSGAKVQKAATIGEWTNVTGGRAFRSANDYYDLGHWGVGYYWSSTSGGAEGLYMKRTLNPGSYVFSMDALATVREATTSTSCWQNNGGLDIAYGYLYITKANGENVDTIATTGYYPLSPREYTTGVLVANIAEAGEYEIGIKAYAYDELKDLKYGGALYVKDAQLYAKTDALYSDAELKYLADVREQITTARNALTTAANNLANPDKPWGHSEVKACVDTIESVVAAYELQSETDSASIIATFDKEAYVRDNRTKTAEDGLMVYEVYVKAAKDILAANSRFKTINDSLGLLKTAITNSENLLADRTYSASTKKTEMQNAISAAKSVYETLLTDEYSDENRQKIEDEIAKLSQANSEYAAGVPEETITTLVDIDFSNDAVSVDETDIATTEGTATITGAAGTMTINPYIGTAAGFTFSKGVDSNGDRVLSDVLLVGRGSGTVPVDLGETGSNIYTVSMDLWVGMLANTPAKDYVGFFLKDENDENVSGIYFRSGAYDYDPCGLGEVGNFVRWNSDTSTKDNIVATCTDAYKHHFVMYLDYGTKKVKLSCVSAAGEFVTDWKDFDGNAFTQFELKCGYDGSASQRRCWFDNLKIQKIAADAVALVGDANGDGQVTMADANAIVNYFLAEDKTTIENFDVTAADINGDGEITMADANAAVNIFLGNSVE